MEQKDRLKVQGIISDAIDECVLALEEDRYHPSIPEAGTAATESAVNQCSSYITDAIRDIVKEFGAIDIDQCIGDIEFDDLLKMITIDNAEDFKELTSVDSFVRDNGESKYRYVNDVYRYKNTDRFICVEVQCTADGQDSIALMQVQETEKKEITTYEWS